MSYYRTWQLVTMANELFREPLVERTRGGGNRGGTSLTPPREQVLALYTRMETACVDATRSDREKLRRLLRR